MGERLLDPAARLAYAGDMQTPRLRLTLPLLLAAGLLGAADLARAFDVDRGDTAKVLRFPHTPVAVFWRPRALGAASIGQVEAALKGAMHLFRKNPGNLTKGQAETLDAMDLRSLATGQAYQVRVELSDIYRRARTPERARYRIGTDTGLEVTCRFLVMATGGLSAARKPRKCATTAALRTPSVCGTGKWGIAASIICNDLCHAWQSRQAER